MFTVQIHSCTPQEAQSVKHKHPQNHTHTHTITQAHTHARVNTHTHTPHTYTHTTCTQTHTQGKVKREGGWQPIIKEEHSERGPDRINRTMTIVLDGSYRTANLSTKEKLNEHTIRAHTYMYINNGPWLQSQCCCCCWLLLYSAILRSQAESLRLHMILHEWTAF